MINRDLKSFALLVTGKTVVVAANLLVTVVLGRLLGPEGLGEWSLVVAAAAFLHTTLVNWTHAGTVRFGSEEWALTGSIQRTLSARMPLLLASIACAGVLLFFQPFGWLELAFGLDSGAWVLVSVYAIGLWFAAEAQATLQAQDRIPLQSILGPIVGICAISALLAIGLAGRVALGPAVLAVSLTSVGIWGTAWLVTVTGSRVRLHVASLADVRRQLTYASPLLLGFAVGYLSDWGDHLLLRRQASTEVVGQFGLAYQVFAAMLAANGALSTLLLPRLVVGQSRSDDASERYLREIVPTLFVLWALGATAVVAALPPLLNSLAGPQFEPAATSLMMLCAVVPASVVTSLYTVMFSLQQRLGRVLLYTSVMTAVNLVLSFLLIPTYGASGAAIGTAVSYAVAQAAYIWDHRRHRKAGKTAVAAVWVVVVVCGIAQVWAGDQPGLRVAWALMSGTAIVWTARRTYAVSGAFVDQLFTGTLAPVGTTIRRTLVPSEAR